MAIFKRGKKYWFHFYWNGQHVQKSTRQGNPRVARQIEAAYKTQLAKGEVGIEERKPAPRFKDFAQTFIDNVAVGRKRAPRASTIEFYGWRLAKLLEFEPLASARLNGIKVELIQSYVRNRLRQVSPTCVNRDLATLRRALNVARELGLIDRIPKITLLEGEHEREFVLTQPQERIYLEFAPQPLLDMAILMIDTGLRVGEAVALEWREIHLNPAHGARFGYLRVRDGKSKYAKRNVPITDRVRDMLESRETQIPGPWVFTNKDGTKPLSRSTVSHQHTRLRRVLQLPEEFVLHSLRHTMLTRLGGAGVDVFAIKRVAGHSSVTVSEKYVHPSPEFIERAFERLEEVNRQARDLIPEAQKRQLPATISATSGDAAGVDIVQRP